MTKILYLKRTNVVYDNNKVNDNHDYSFTNVEYNGHLKRYLQKYHDNSGHG